MWRNLLESINVFERGSNLEGAKLFRRLFGNNRTAITDISTSSGTMSTAEREKFNAVLAALRGKGLID